MMNVVASDSRRFAVGLSFPGEHRDFVAEVAGYLAEAFGKARVLYDKYHEAEFARLDLDVYLPGLYREQSELIVLFLCPEYAAKRWCNLEWRHIRQLIATADAGRIMILRYGFVGNFADLGILNGDGVINYEGRPAGEIGDLIVKRFHINKGTAPPDPPTSARCIPVDIFRIGRYAPTKLIGREAETNLLDESWAKAQNDETARPRVLTFVGLGGEGKTSLVANWLAGLAERNWPACDRVFAWSFYSQGAQDQSAASSDLFLKEALVFFGDTETAGGALGAHEKARQLAQLAGQQRALLILDGVEPLQYAPIPPMDGALKDQGLAALLKGLAAKNRGLCVVTTRHSIPDLRAYLSRTVHEENLKRLSTKAGRELLEHLGVKGAPQERETLVEDVKGHALTLNLLGTWLNEAYGGDIRKRDLIKLQEADEEQGGHTFRVMDTYVQWLESGDKNGKCALAMLRLMGLFDRPADVGCLKAVWKAPEIRGLTEPLAGMSEAHRNLALRRLEKAKLVTVSRNGAGELVLLDTHPLIREYFAKQLWERVPNAWRAAHRRIYQHLYDTTEEGPEPTLEDLQPLYQAVYHGCQAEMQQEACTKLFRDRIACRAEAYSVKKLGAFGSDLGALACFFEQFWSRVSPALAKADQAWLLHEAAARLRALGRLTEALEPMQVSLIMNVERWKWEDACVVAANLAQLELTMGDVAKAVADSERAVIYAERSFDMFQRMSKRAYNANALHQGGSRDEAAERFREAEVMEAVRRPEMPLLCSLMGFLYCDLILATAERAAWRLTVDLSSLPSSSAASESCRIVSKRAAQALIADGNNSLLDIALDDLSFGRAALYAWILQDRPPDKLNSCRVSLQDAVNSLRRAGQQEYLALGLLTRAWLRCLDGVHIGLESAQEDLDETWEIAERGPMPLFMADIHLHRARLFGLSKDPPATYPWVSPQKDLREARRLIEKHGYGRRKEELEDAEEAAARP